MNYNLLQNYNYLRGNTEFPVILDSDWSERQRPRVMGWVDSSKSQFSAASPTIGIPFKKFSGYSSVYSK